MTYWFDLAQLIVAVYFLPALAFFPKLITRPLWFAAAPILSAFMVYLGVGALHGMGLFNHTIVLSITLAMGLMAFWRLIQVGRHETFEAWSRIHAMMLCVNFLILLPFAVKLGTSAFDRGDEIYSWHFWAVQHYFSEVIDFSHTGAAYPQLLPKLLAWGYQLLGTLKAQLPTKALLILFPFTMLNALAFLGVQTRSHLLRYLVVIAWGLFGIGVSQYFDDGYADPVMTGCLVMSVALLIQGIRSQSQMTLMFSLGCGLAASMTKQPALIWSLWGLPISVLCFADRKKYTTYLIALLSIAGALAWFALEGRTFLNNDGVLGHSLAHRDIGAQLLYAANKYLLKMPLLLVLFLATAWSVRRDRLLNVLFYAFIVPSTLAWFIGGAYHLRLGQHIVALCLLLILATPFALSFGASKSQRWAIPIISVMACVSVILSGWMGWHANRGMHWDTPGLITLNRYFPQDAQMLHERLYNRPDVLLWVPTRYLYGIFYAHTPVIEPDYQRFQPYDQDALVTELLETQPDYVFVVDKTVAGGPAAECLKALIKTCPSWFKVISAGPNRYHYQVYKTDWREPCQ